jgi:hypothetical protein
MGEKKEKDSTEEMLDEFEELCDEKKPMSWQSTLIILAFIIGLFALLLAMIIPPVNLGARCDIQGIRYADVCPNACWHSEISCRFCPLPTNIACDLNAKAPVLKLIELFK